MSEPLPKLVLYKFDTCPYCLRVLRFVEQNAIAMSFRDTHQDPGARQELLAIGGKTQVPCLLIDGQPLYESAAILGYLQRLLVKT